MKRMIEIVLRGRFEDALFYGTVSVDGKEPVSECNYYIDDNLDFAQLLQEGSVHIDFILDNELADSIMRECGELV